jgi:FG-GAP repeat protein
MTRPRAWRSWRTRGTVATSVCFLVAQLLLATAMAPYVAGADAEWIQTDALTAAGGYGRQFGKSVAIEGDTMVVGAEEGDHVRVGDFCGQGAAYVFTRSGSPLWQLVARLLPSRLDCSDEFGASVSISGDWIAVGDPHDNILPPGEEHGSDEEVSWQGSVSLYKKPAGGWQDATETQYITEFDGAEAAGNPDWDDAFGASVKLVGTTLFVGASGWDANGPQTGAVFVYQNPIDAGWEQAATLTPSEPLPRGRFGGGLAYSNGTLLVGNTEGDNGWAWASYYPTAAYIFEEPVDGWATTSEETAKLDLGGWTFAAVALDGDTAVVADNHAQGSVVFTKPLNGWASTSQSNARLVPGYLQTGGIYGGLYGAAVAIEDDVVVVTAPNNIADPNHDRDGGEAWVYRRPADGWGAADDPITVDAETSLRDNGVNGVLGWSVTIVGGTVALGDIGADQYNFELGVPNSLAGQVSVFGESTDVDGPVTAIAREPLEQSGANGWDKGPVALHVTGDDGPTGSGIAEVRCKLDPPLPITRFEDLPAGSCAYADADGGSVAAEGFHALYAASIDGAGNRGPLTSLSLQIDTRPPSTFITLSPAEPDQDDGTYSVPVDVRLDYGDDAQGSGRDTVRCMLDPIAPPTTFDEMPTTLCGTDFFIGTGRRFDSGSHTIWIAAQDRAGNVSVPQSASFTIDRGPTVAIALNPATPDGSNGWWRNPVRVTVTGTAAPGGPTPAVRCVLDPAVAPTSFDQLPATCPYLGGGALVSTDGQHTLYAAAGDSTGSTSSVQSASFRVDRTPPTLTCDGTGPATFTIREAEGAVTAAVTDSVSGPVTTTATTPLTAANLGSVGNRTAAVTAADLAGNTGTVNCAYQVGYDVDIASPEPGDTFSAGTTVAVTFQLLDANGVPISDASAALLAGGRKSPCFIDALFDGVAQRGCPTYAAATDVFTLKVKTPKGKNVLGLHDLGIQVRDPGGTGVVNVVLVVIQLTK